LPIIFKLSYQLYLQGDDKFAWASLHKALHSCEEDIIKDHSGSIKLNDILSLHYQQDTLHNFMRDLGKLVLEGVELPSDGASLELTEDHLQPVALFTLNTVVKSPHWLAALCSYLNHFLVASSDKQVEKVWKVLEIIRVLLHSETKSKPDISSLQNSLISIISKLPEDAMETENDIQPESLRKIANSLLKQSISPVVLAN